MERLAPISQSTSSKGKGGNKRPIPEIPDAFSLVMSWGLLLISGASWIAVSANPSYKADAIVINTLLLTFMVLALGVPVFMAGIQKKPLRGKKFLSWLLLSLHLCAVMVVSSGHQQNVLWGTFYLWAFAAGALIKQRLLVRTFLPWTLYGISVQVLAHHSLQHIIVVSCFFIAALCIGNAVLSAVIRAARQRATHQLDAEILRWYEDARDYRLLAGGSVRDSVAPFSTALSHPPEWESEEELSAKRLKATTQVVRESVFRLLVLSARVLEPDCVVLYLFDETRKKLVLKEQFIRLDDQAQKIVPPDQGAIGLCIQKGQPIQLSRLEKNNDLVTHRKGLPQAQHLLVIPIQHQVDLMGVLVFDRARY